MTRRLTIGCIAVLCIYLLFIVFSSHAIKYGFADEKNYLAPVISLLNKKWPQNRTIRIVVHGHSIPAGYFLTPVVNTFAAYPHLVHQQLKNAYPYAVINMITTAIGGEDSVGGAKRFEQDVLPLHPDILIIDYGINDPHLGVETARQAWQEMIDKAKANNIKVILLTPLPAIHTGINNPAEPLLHHVAMIRELAAKNQVALVDAFAVAKRHVDGGGDMADIMCYETHPNERGHKMIADEIMRWFTNRR